MTTATKNRTVDIPLSELEPIDITDKVISRIAKGYILGTTQIGNSRTIRKNLDERVTKKIGSRGRYLTNKLFELIEGISVIDNRTGPDGKKMKYYKTPPSLPAIIYALDRVLGKPKQFMETTEEKRGVLLVEHIIKNLADKNNGNGVGKNVDEEERGITNGGSDSEFFSGDDEGVGALAV